MCKVFMFAKFSSIATETASNKVFTVCAAECGTECVRVLRALSVHDRVSFSDRGDGVHVR